jgi:hypothetical protein
MGSLSPVARASSESAERTMAVTISCRSVRPSTAPASNSSTKRRRPRPAPAQASSAGRSQNNPEGVGCKQPVASTSRGASGLRFEVSEVLRAAEGAGLHQHFHELRNVRLLHLADNQTVLAVVRFRNAGEIPRRGGKAQEHANSVVGTGAKVLASDQAATKPIISQTTDGSGQDKFVSPITTPAPLIAPLQPTESAKSDVGTRTKVAVATQTSKASDPVLEKAKTTVASKMEYPTSVEFEDMTRAIRKDSFEQYVDTVCGHVSGKKASGAETGKRAFVYLVKEDIAFVDYGYPGSVAGNAFRRICTTGY